MSSRSGTAAGGSRRGEATGRGVGGERGREIASLLLLGATLFLALACLTAGHGDNLCGPTGERVSVALLATFGHAAWLIVLCLGSWGLALFTRSGMPAVGLRVSGLVLCLVSTSALLAHLFGDVPARWAPGGTLGRFLALQLEVSGGLGPMGTRIALVVATLITFVLATDAAYYASLVAGARWAADKAARVSEARALARAEAEAEAEEAGFDEPGTRLVPRARQRPAATAVALDDDFVEDEDEEPEAGEEALFGGVEQALEDELAAEQDEPDESDTDGELDDEDLSDEDEADEADEEDEPDSVDDLDEESLAESGDDDDTDDEDSAAFDEDLDEDLDEEQLEDDDELRAAAADDDLSGDEGLERLVRGRPRVREMIDPAAQAPLPFQPRPLVPSAYVFPSENLLDDQEAVDQVELDELLADKTETLERTLLSFKIEAKVVEIQKGPVISMFEMELAPGIKLGRVRALEDDLAIALRARSVRIVAPLPGKNTIGIEVPNPIRETVRLKPLLHCREYDDSRQALPVFLGRDNAGRPLVMDLARMPHLLVAGATGAGKSVCLNTIICSFLYTRTPEQVKLILIDPKMVEMSLFEHAPHLACPVVTDMKRAPGILEWAVNKMEERYKLLARAGVRNILSYNKLSEEKLRARFGESVDSEDFPRKLPYVVIVVDELADLMMTAAKDVETSISRLAAKSRAVGIHIILATQRPSTNVITGLIKANLPTRIAFMVSSKIDSRVILDSNGAEQLLGAGDMLLLTPAHTGLVRGQCTFMSDDEVGLVMDSVKTASGPVYERELVQRRSESDQDPTELDELYDPAVRFIIGTQRGSASLLQRKFAIGYTRASRLIDLMAVEGVLGEYKGSQARDVEMTLDEWVGMNPELRASGEDEQQGEPAAAAGG